MRFRQIFFIILILCAAPLSAQQPYSWHDFQEDYLSDEERAEDEDVLYEMEDLKRLHEQPMDINMASVEDLLQLPFLSEAQIEQLHAYVYLHGPLQTLSELRLVPLLDELTRRRLSLFVYAGTAPSDASADKHFIGPLHHDFSTRLDIPLYYRQGQQTDDGYRGNPLYQRLRYTMTDNRHLQVGLRMEKDAGERFPDSHGGYVILQDVGFLGRAVAGDYRIGFGEGLVMGGSTWSSKSSPTLKTQSGLRPMTSMDEVNFLRGAAVTLNASRHLTVSLLGSYRERDATLNSQEEVQTLLTTGYHRTATEWERRRNVGSTTAGGNVQWQGGGFHLGATGYWQHFSRTLNPGTQQYRAIYPKGDSFGVAGLNYGYTRYRLSLGGETAYSTTGGAGTINRLSWIISRSYTVSVVQRFYAYQYYSFFSNALSENSNAQNESGVLVHLQAEPLSGLQLTAYADFFYHPWPRYRMTHSSSGQDFMLQGLYSLTRRSTLLLRYQLKRKESADQMEPHHRIKVQWTLNPSLRWQWQTTGTLHTVLGSTGMGLAESVRCTLPKPGLALRCQVGYFHVDDYASRVYFSLPALYTSVSSASFYGHGMHGTLACRWQSRHQRIMLEARYALVRYFDRDTQGTGLQTIHSRWKNDLSLQLRLKL